MGFNDLETAKSKGGSKNCKSETSAGAGAGVLYSLSEDLNCYLINSLMSIHKINICQ